MKIFSTDGAQLGSISNPSGSISPWANVQYHDLSTDPTAIVGTDATVTSVEWDGASALTLPHELGDAVSFDGWTGTNGETVMSSDWTVTDYGTVHVHGRRTGENGRIVEVQRTFEIIPETVINGVGTIAATPCTPTTNRSTTVLNAAGQWVAHWPNGQTTDHGLPTGMYFVQTEGCPVRKIQLQ
jgi:hypothetical protein